MWTIQKTPQAPWRADARATGGAAILRCSRMPPAALHAGCSTCLGGCTRQVHLNHSDALQMHCPLAPDSRPSTKPGRAAGARCSKKVPAAQCHHPNTHLGHQRIQIASISIIRAILLASRLDKPWHERNGHLRRLSTSRAHTNAVAAASMPYAQLEYANHMFQLCHPCDAVRCCCVKFDGTSVECA